MQYSFTPPKFLFLVCSLVTSLFSNAQSWSPVQGDIPGVRFTGIAADTSSTDLVVTTLTGGIYRSTNSGDSWQQVFTTTDSIFSLLSLDGKHFCAGGKGTTYVSSDSGKTWSSHMFPFRVAVSKIVLHPSGALIAATGSRWDILNNEDGKGVFLSIDSGKTWTALNNGITMQNAHIEAIAVLPDGDLLIGIHDDNVGLNGKHGIMKLDSLTGSWRRLSISVKAPSNQDYPDQNLRISSVFNIDVVDGWVISSITGVYANFGYAFTIQKPFQDIDNASESWQVKWVIDSIPSQGSYYEHLVSVFQDSKRTVWASVANPSNEINNSVFTGDLNVSAPWSIQMDGLTEQLGRMLFAEGAGDRLFTISYFMGDKVFVRSTTVIPVSINEPMNDVSNNWSLYPNPTRSTLQLYHPAASVSESVLIKVLDFSGKQISEQFISRPEGQTLTLATQSLASGIYFLSITTGGEQQVLRFVKGE